MITIEKMKSLKADWIDVGFIKISVFAAALMIAKLWEPILSLDWYWYLIISIMTVIRPLKNWCKWVRTILYQ